MASTVLKEVRAKTLPEIRIDESVDLFHNWLREIPCECHAFEFANELLCKQYRSVIARVLRLKNLEQECYKDGDTECAVNCHSRSIEAKRRFCKLVRDAVGMLTDNGLLADDIVYDTDHLIEGLINELRLMGQ